MASQVEMGIGFVMEALSTSSSSSSITGNYSTNVAKNAYLCDIPVTDDTLPIDDLIDFSTQDGVFDDHLLPQSAEISFTSVPMGFPLFGDGNGQSYNNDSSSPESGSHLAAFPDDLCIIPSEEAAELEWLSKFVEESFSDTPFTSPGTMVDFSNIIPSSTTGTTNSNPSDHYHNASVFPGRARSKRSRQSEPPSSSSSSSSSSSDSKQRKGNGGKKKNNNSTMTMIMTPGAAAGSGGGGSESIRKCTHCSSEKTPQWRMGPLGPKTLCNACGVRYNSGRLVPEYRPAASPTFVLTQHSNSHRKVMELRRQKEEMFRHQSHQYDRESSPPTTTTLPDPTCSSGTTRSAELNDPQLDLHHLF